MRIQAKAEISLATCFSCMHVEGMTPKSATFGELLKSTLRKHGISTSELSRRIMTSTSNLQNIEAGRRRAGAVIVGGVINELDLSQDEREILLQAAAADSDAVKAGIELGSWRVALQWWSMFGVDAVKSMGLNPDCPNRQFRLWPVAHDIWLIRCHFHNPDVLVVLGYNKDKARIEAAHRDYDLRTSTPLPTRATRWWPCRVMLGLMSSDGTPIICLSAENNIQIRNSSDP